jgi:tetratricopeptide (TPR) repeat protein/transcriptional regulator with XRE-family HTH domain
MAEQPAPGFAGLLRELRAEAQLTQEELAEAASLSPRSVSDLERGIHPTARKDTAVLLAGALGLAEPARSLFVAAATGRIAAAQVLAAIGEQAPVASAAAATRALPSDIASFTGRERELALLLAALASVPASGGAVSICLIDGMAGMGKTSLAVHAAHRLAAGFPDGQFFLPLHAHTPGQRRVEPAAALASLLLAAGVPAGQIPPGAEARAARWRDHTAGKKILLLLDDAAGHEQVRPLLPGTAGSLVLVTSRRRLAALPDATVISLDTLEPAEAAVLFARVAARPGLRANDADDAVGRITGLCGYLPLAIGMLAGQLRHHPAWTAAGLAAGLVAAQDRLAEMHAENLSVAAAFDLSYADLTPDQQRLFRRLGLVPGPSIDAHAAAALDDTSLAGARRGLDELYDQHLLTEPAPGRYVLHDLLREHARALAAAGDPAESDAATGRLLDYYLHTALAAARQLPFWDSVWDALSVLPTARPPACAPPISTSRQAAAWLDAELANLQAAAGYAAASGRLTHAMLIPAAMADFLKARGRWDQAVAVHLTALAAARQAGDRPGQARALMSLSDARYWTGDREGAVAAAQQALALYRDLGDRTGQAYAVCMLGFWHRADGDCQSAAACYPQALELFRGLGDRAGEAEALTGLSFVQQTTGDYRAAAASAREALELLVDLGNRYGQAWALVNLGNIQALTGDYPAAASAYHQAQALSEELDDRLLQAWLPNQLGVLHRLTGDYQAAAASHQQALQLLREVGDPTLQGYPRNDLGLAQQETGDYQAAAASHQQALSLMRETGQPYGQADVLNSLGELASRTSATSQAREHHSQALAIARQIGAPLEEARALEGTGRSHLQDGHHDQGIAFLRQALAIYQRIGAPAARRVHDTLASHGSLTAQDR